MGSWGRLSELTIGTSCGAGKRGALLLAQVAQNSTTDTFQGKTNQMAAAGCSSSRGLSSFEEVLLPESFSWRSFLKLCCRVGHGCLTLHPRWGIIGSIEQGSLCAALYDSGSGKKRGRGKQGSSFWRRFCAAAHLASSSQANFIAASHMSEQLDAHVT